MLRGVRTDPPTANAPRSRRQLHDARGLSGKSSATTGGEVLVLVLATPACGAYRTLRFCFGALAAMWALSASRGSFEVRRDSGVPGRGFRPGVRFNRRWGRSGGRRRYCYLCSPALSSPPRLLGHSDVRRCWHGWVDPGRVVVIGASGGSVTEGWPRRRRTGRSARSGALRSDGDGTRGPLSSVYGVCRARSRALLSRAGSVFVSACVSSNRQVALAPWAPPTFRAATGRAQLTATAVEDIHRDTEESVVVQDVTRLIMPFSAPARRSRAGRLPKPVVRRRFASASHRSVVPHRASRTGPAAAMCSRD